MKIAGAVLFAAVALAQTPSEPKPAVVEGKVVNSVTGEAIRKAELTLTTDLMPDNFAAIAAQAGLDTAGLDTAGLVTSDPSKVKEPKKTFTAASDAAGKFRFDHIAPGDYYFTIKHAGFVDLTYKSTGPGRADGMVHMKAGQELSDLELRLVPQGAAAGKVIDEDGDPVADAMVTAEAASFSSGRRRLQLTDSATTNDRGEFRLGKLPPGRYYIGAEVIDMNPMATVPPPPKDGQPETGYVCTYFPKTTDSALAEAVDVQAGIDVPGLTIQLQKSRVVRVKGKAVDDDGKPLKGAQIMLMAGGRPGSMRMIMVNDPEGKFELANVAPGTYLAMIMQLQDHKMVQQPLTVPNENLSDIKLGTVVEGSVKGRVNVTGDGKVKLKGLAISLTGDEDSPIMPANAVAGETGAFLLKKVVSASYELDVPNLPAGAYLKSVLWNGKETLGEPFDFSAGVAGDLQVFLGTDGGAFDAKVARADGDGKPIADATVVLLPEDPSRRNPETTRSESTGEAGHAEFRDVPPGDYLAIAWEKVEEGDWFDPAVVKAAGGVRVTIAPKNSQHMDLKAIPSK